MKCCVVTLIAALALLLVCEARILAPPRAKRQLGGLGTGALGGNGNGGGLDFTPNAFRLGNLFNMGSNVGVRPSPNGVGWSVTDGGGIPVLCSALGLTQESCQLQKGIGMDLNANKFANAFSNVKKNPPPQQQQRFGPPQIPGAQRPGTNDQLRQAFGK